MIGQYANYSPGCDFIAMLFAVQPMPTSTPAAPTKLIMCQPLGAGRRLLIEITPDDTITTTWLGRRAPGQPTRDDPAFEGA